MFVADLAGDFVSFVVGCELVVYCYVSQIWTLAPFTLCTWSPFWCDAHALTVDFSLDLPLWACCTLLSWLEVPYFSPDETGRQVTKFGIKLSELVIPVCVHMICIGGAGVVPCRSKGSIH